MSAVKIALLFVEAINSANIEMLAGLMTEDHAFIDADGSEHSGSQKMRVGWQDYFSIVPDFKIKINDHFERENIVVLIGTAEGTFIDNGKIKAENHWKVPAAWRVNISNNKVMIWQLFTNQEPMIKIYNRIHSPNKRFNPAKPDADR
ncbi:MAG: nuclear transport factor 2 family protein [Planctomycetota bacterium]|jgi:hypothetical protein